MNLDPADKEPEITVKIGKNAVKDLGGMRRLGSGHYRLMQDVSVKKIADVSYYLGMCQLAAKYRTLYRTFSQTHLSSNRIHRARD
jgi:hypothetical protein